MIASLFLDTKEQYDVNWSSFRFAVVVNGQSVRMARNSCHSDIVRVSASGGNVDGVRVVAYPGSAEVMRVRSSFANDN